MQVVGGGIYGAKCRSLIWVKCWQNITTHLDQDIVKQVNIILPVGKLSVKFFMYICLFYSFVLFMFVLCTM